MDHVIIYTDGACSGNPGPGGWAAILLCKGKRRELSGGFAHTSNNRMELRAVIEALRALKRPCRVDLHSDSKYVVDAFRLGWLKSWERQGWRRGREKKPVKNLDLWQELLEATKQHQIEFLWVEGHAESEENNRCDELAVEASHGDDLPVDDGFEEG